MKVQVCLFLIFITISSIKPKGCEINRKTPNLKQCNSEWGSQTLLKSHHTICEAGSKITIIASVLQSVGKTVHGQVATPDVLSEAIKHEAARSGVQQALAAYGLNFVGIITDKNEIKNHICANDVVLLVNEANGHLVLAIGFEKEFFHVNDPTQENRESYATNQVSKAFVYSL